MRRSREIRLGAQAEADPGPTALEIDEHMDRLVGFDRLPTEDRAILALRYHLDLTVPDVADALGIRLGTAKARLSRAVGRLRAELRDDQA